MSGDTCYHCGKPLAGTEWYWLDEEGFIVDDPSFGAEPFHALCADDHPLSEEALEDCR